ncbi:unnamed protein product [Paramecium octaurelia]|uniref:non-specific serine/threonine protein kinase n=1 Tax=Paramecium octaurelia TaxID=43137 RepID=A0A8S1VQW5_PAROT|nr:unnamed protein product [Paramecium octaurelia]
MGNKCLKPHHSDMVCRNTFVDEFYAFKQLNDQNTEPILNQASIKDYQLLKVLGRGGFGKVMLVQHKKNNQLYAMKIINKKNLTSEWMRRSAKTERQLLEILDSPFIVKLIEAFQTQQKLYLVVEYMSGGELFQYLKHYGKFSEDVAKFYAAQILLSLEYLHSNGIVYRDLKPQNILLEKGYIKLTDFGLSTRNDGLQFSQCGTIDYLAPEVLGNQGYTNKCDVWSFGVVLYQMLIGCDTEQIEFENTSISTQAKDLLSHLLDVNVNTRYNLQQAQQHVFFEDIDFEALSKKKIIPQSMFLEHSRFKFFSKSCLEQSAVDTEESECASQVSQFTYNQYKSKISRADTLCSSYGVPKSF